MEPRPVVLLRRAPLGRQARGHPCYDPRVRGDHPFDLPTADIVDLSFWRGKRVFLTGHTGFKGSWLALWLQRLGAEVT
ncbi:MAG: hypothetical protein V3T81_06920, partial [Thermoanaerobaculia bacterium]